MSSPSKVVRAVYRAFLRQAKALDGPPPSTIRVVVPIPIASINRLYGRGVYVPVRSSPPAESSSSSPSSSTSSSSSGTAAAFFPLALSALCEEGLQDRKQFTGKEMKAVVRRAFRQKVEGVGLDQEDPTTVALESLQALSTQRALQQCSSSATTTYAQGVEVRVEVTTVGIPGLSRETLASAAAFPFAYRIRIVNSGTRTVKVVGRHWQFTDTAGGSVEVPKGSPGVVGHSPILEPGMSFVYYSGTQLKSGAGSMKGSFQMIVPATEDKFDAMANPTALIWDADGKAGEEGQGKAAGGDTMKSR